jgi:hypothetical protein
MGLKIGLKIGFGDGRSLAKGSDNRECSCV